MRCLESGGAETESSKWFDSRSFLPPCSPFHVLQEGACVHHTPPNVTRIGAHAHPRIRCGCCCWDSTGREKPLSWNGSSSTSGTWRLTRSKARCNSCNSCARSPANPPAGGAHCLWMSSLHSRRILVTVQPDSCAARNPQNMCCCPPLLRLPYYSQA